MLNRQGRRTRGTEAARPLLGATAATRCDVQPGEAQEPTGADGASEVYSAVASARSDLNTRSALYCYCQTNSSQYQVLLQCMHTTI